MGFKRLHKVTKILLRGGRGRGGLGRHAVLDQNGFGMHLRNLNITPPFFPSIHWQSALMYDEENHTQSKYQLTKFNQQITHGLVWK